VLGVVSRVIQMPQHGSVALVEVCCCAGGSQRRGEAMFSAGSRDSLESLRVVPATNHDERADGHVIEAACRRRFVSPVLGKALAAVPVPFGRMVLSWRRINGGTSTCADTRRVPSAGSSVMGNMHWEGRTEECSALAAITFTYEG
jgi:hypothetical protein